MADYNSSIFNLTTQGLVNESSIQFNSTATVPNVIKPVDNWSLVKNDPAFKIALSINLYGYRAVHGTATVLNAIILITMLSSQKLRHNSSGILIIFLAILEFIDSLLRLLNHVFLLGLCMAHEFFNSFIIFVGNNLILLIAINRFALVCFPFKHRPVTNIRSTLIQIAVLAVTGVAATSYLFAVDYVFDTWTGCRIKLTTFDLYYKGALIVLISMGSFFPSVGTMILTIIFIYTPKRHNAQLWSVFEQIYLYLGFFFSMNRINNFFLYLVYHTRFRVRLLQLIKCKWRASSEN